MMVYCWITYGNLNLTGNNYDQIGLDPLLPVEFCFKRQLTFQVPVDVLKAFLFLIRDLETPPDYDL